MQPQLFRLKLRCMMQRCLSLSEGFLNTWSRRMGSIARIFAAPLSTSVSVLLCSVQYGSNIACSWSPIRLDSELSISFYHWYGYYISSFDFLLFSITKSIYVCVEISRSMASSPIQ